MSETLPHNLTTARDDFVSSKHFLPNLLQSKAGKIVHVFSDFGSLGGMDLHCCYVNDHEHDRKLTRHTENVERECIAYSLVKTPLNQQTVSICPRIQGRWAQDIPDECQSRVDTH
jgi:hypothetical protein